MSSTSNSNAAQPKNAPAPLVPVPFHGGHLYAAGGEYPNPGDRPVPLKQACERLGLTMAPQLIKLKNVAWAVVSEIDMTASDGKIYKMACIPLRAFPMWLASINPGKVSKSLRDLLVAYQREAADVLYRHFLPRAAANDVDFGQLMAEALATAVGPLVTRIGTLQTKMEEQADRIVTLQLRLSGNGTIGLARARKYLLNPLLALAQSVDPVGWKSVRAQLESELRADLGYFGALDLMTEAMLPLAHRCLLVMQRREARRLRRRPGLARTSPRQLTLRPVVGAN